VKIVPFPAHFFQTFAWQLTAPDRRSAQTSPQTMFNRLQKKWKVNGLQLLLVLCTFAIGGSLTGYAGRKLMNLLPIEANWLWVVIYIIVVTLLWPLAVLLVSIPFRQFRFFTAYLYKMGVRMKIVGRKGEAKSEKSEVESAK